MRIPRSSLALAVLLVWRLLTSDALAQTSRESRGYAGAKVGANHEEAEDGLRGTSVAGGAVVGFSLSRDWTLDVEVWVPKFLRDENGSPKHRDVLVSASAVRFFTDGAIRPFVLAGLSLAFTEDRLTTCIADRVPFGQTGPAVPTIVDCSQPDVRERVDERFRSQSVYGLGGAGLEIRVAPRVRISPDVRFDVAVTSFIVRPSVAVSITF
jgi:hypothetical protein